MRAKTGFTLVEVLVTLVLIGLLIGIVLPAVMNQLDRGDYTRVAADLEAIRSGSRVFRVDVKRYPASLEQLTEAPGGSGAPSWDRATDLGGGTIADGLLSAWDGPYLEGAAVSSEATALATALGAQIQPVFSDTATLAGVPYLTVFVLGLQSADIAAISELVDGDIVLTHDDAGGRVRGTVDGSATVDTLYYLAIPAN